jgi:hypothetical protein
MTRFLGGLIKPIAVMKKANDSGASAATAGGRTTVAEEAQRWLKERFPYERFVRVVHPEMVRFEDRNTEEVQA